MYRLIIKYGSHFLVSYLGPCYQVIDPLNLYINGTKVPDGTNYRDIKLNAHDEIAIVYGIYFKLLGL